MAKHEIRVATEVAEQEFERFLESMDILIDPTKLDAEDLTAFNKQKQKIVWSIERGYLIINEEGEPVYTPWKTENIDAITFHERTGASLMAIDGKKKGHDVAKTYAMMADLTGTHPSVFAKLRGMDIKVCESLFNLLMD